MGLHCSAGLCKEALTEALKSGFMFVLCSCSILQELMPNETAWLRGQSLQMVPILSRYKFKIVSTISVFSQDCGCPLKMTLV